MQEVGSVQEWSSFPGERYGGIEGGMDMGAAPTVEPQAWVLAVGKGQGPTGSSPLTCEGQCSDSHSTVGFPHPCHSPVILSMAHRAQLPDAQEASLLSVPGPSFLWALSPLAASCRGLLTISLPLGSPLWCSCQDHLHSLCCMRVGC